MNDTITEERIQRIEKQLADIRRARTGLQVQAGVNRLGQLTAVEGVLDMQGHQIKNVADATDNQDAVTYLPFSTHTHGGGGGAAIDHGVLLGLLDDDHTQYASANGSGTRAAYEATRLSRSITAGAGLTGGGQLTADITLDVGAGVGISVSADAVAIDPTASLTWTGTHVFQNTLTTRSIIPELTDTYDIGSTTKLWRKGYLSELDAVVFAINTITLLGGWLFITKNEGTLKADLTAVDTEANLGTYVPNNDFVLFRGLGQVEYIKVVSYTGYGYVYNVTRNLDGSGANAWPKGTPFAVLGNTGNGRIELNAYDTPRIQLITQGATYNAQTESIRIGDLNGNWGYSAEIWGMAIGEYATNKPNITIDPTNGLRIRNYTTDVLKFDVSGNAIISGKLKMDQTGSAIAIGTTPPTSATAGTGIWIDRTGLYGLNANVQQAYINNAGQIVAGAGKLSIDSNGLWLTDVVGTNTPIKFWEDYASASYQIGRILADWGGTAPQDAIVWTIASHQTGDPWNYADVILIAHDYVTSKEARITLRTDGMVAVQGGLVIGLSSAVPASGELWLKEITSGSTPVGGLGNVYVKSDSQLYFKNDGGTEYRLNAEWKYLIAPLTSTSWDGDARSTTAKTVIDLSAVFGVPAGVKAVYVQVLVRDSASVGADLYFILGAGNAPGVGMRYACDRVANDWLTYYDGVVPCDANGDIWYQVAASGTLTMDVWLQIYGYLY